MHRTMRRPMIQRSVFSFAKANPRELLRSRFDSSEIEHRALTYLPDSMLRDVPASSSPFSLFDGFRATLPEEPDEAGKHGGRRRRYGRLGSRGQKLLEEEEKGPPGVVKLKNTKYRLDHRLEMLGVRKSMAASEIKEIDVKIANLNTMRKTVLDRLAGLEQEEHDLEQEIVEVANSLEEMQEELEDQAALATKSPVLNAVKEEKEESTAEEEDEGNSGFMSESIYEKLPKTPPKAGAKRKKGPVRRISMPILHEHLEPGSRIREFPAHNDIITALDFDAPFGTMVTAALDDTVRVWDLNAGRCMGMLEGHLSSVRCLQVEENLTATGSMDASIRLWDLSQADYNPSAAASSSITNKRPQSSEDGEAEASGDDGELFTPAASDAAAEPEPTPPSHDAMADCHVYTLSAHVAEVTALNFRGNTLVSGSADKTLRQWDLEKGRCVQTLDVLWAAQQASTIHPTGINTASTTRGGLSTAGGGSGDDWWRAPNVGGRMQSAEADFVGALQVFDAALACGTADGMVRLWDLRSGMVHRSLVGHTGPVTALQFDDVYLVTGSRDRSIRVSQPAIQPTTNSFILYANEFIQIWDLRTGSIHDAYAYDNPISSMHFDARRIIAAAGEDVVKVYDKTDGRHWDCGAGVGEEEETGKGVVERVRIRDGYCIEGRRDGVVGVWSC